LFYPKIPDYSILKRLKETGRRWTLDNGSFFHFQLCIAEAAMEDLTSSEAQFAYLLQFKTVPIQTSVLCRSRENQSYLFICPGELHGKHCFRKLLSLHSRVVREQPILAIEAREKRREEARNCCRDCQTRTPAEFGIFV
jgi:hypothetical protein